MEAERRTHDFVVTHSRVSRGGVLHVITGRGRGSAGRPVLPSAVERVLAGSARQFVADYARDLDDGGYLIRLR